MSEGTSGYDIRADLLGHAQGLLEMNIGRKVDAYYASVDKNSQTDLEFPTDSISAEEVIATARQLNSFVNEK
jgi:hypothetical protein